GAQGFIFCQSLPQSIQTFCNFFIGKTSQIFSPQIYFYSRDNAGIHQYRSYWLPIFCLLSDGFIIQNGTPDAFIKSWCCSEEFAVIASHFQGLWNSVGRKTFVTSWGAFIHGKNPFTIGK